MTTPGARVVVTLFAPVMVWLVAGSGSPWNFSGREFIADDGLGIGLAPVVTAFLLVELAAAVMPQWRALRVSGPEGRAKLDHAAWRLAALLMVWDLVTVMMHVAGSLVSWSGWLMLLMIANVVWTGTLVFIARTVSRLGLVNGYALLLAFDWIPARFFSELARGPWFPVVAMLTLSAVIAGVIESRGATQTEGDLTLHAPLSGITPFALCTALLGVPDGPIPELSWWLHLDWLRDLSAGAPGATVVSTVLALLFTFGLSHLFNRGALILAFLPSGSVPHVMSRFDKALGLSLLLALCLAVGTQLLTLWAYLPLFATIPAAACFAGLLLDAVAELRARVKLGHLAPVWSEQRPYALGSLSAALTQAGIPHHVRGLRLRTLLPHVPLVPAELLVAPARLDAALEVLTARNADSLAAVQAHAPSTF